MYSKYSDKVYKKLIVTTNLISALVLLFIVTNLKINKKYFGYKV